MPVPLRYGEYIRIGIEVVITALTRNQVTGNRPWVRIPPYPPKRTNPEVLEASGFSLFFNALRLFAFSDFKCVFPILNAKYRYLKRNFTSNFTTNYALRKALIAFLIAACSLSPPASRIIYFAIAFNGAFNLSGVSRFGAFGIHSPELRAHCSDFFRGAAALPFRAFRLYRFNGFKRIQICSRCFGGKLFIDIFGGSRYTAFRNTVPCGSILLPLSSAQEFILGCGVFFYIDYIIQTLFTVGRIEDYKVYIIRSDIRNTAVSPYRKRKRGRMFVYAVFRILIFGVFCFFPTAICSALYDFAKTADCFFLCVKFTLLIFK